MGYSEVLRGTLKDFRGAVGAWPLIGLVLRGRSDMLASGIPYSLAILGAPE